MSSSPNKKRKTKTQSNQSSLFHFFLPFTLSLDVDCLECPVCGKQVSMTTSQDHVNQCLDQRCEGKPAIASSASVVQHDNSAFDILMKKQSTVTQSIDTCTKKRTVPFYKILQGMPLSVDAFRYGKIDQCQGYFLTHFHSDHYGGLTKAWNHGPIYCSTITANLCRTLLGVESKWLFPIQMETITVIPNSGGINVTAIDANHCPGSCLFLFQGTISTTTRNGNGDGKMVRYLHCGDFRATPKHINHSLIRDKPLDIIYLDTTYLNPKYCFPPQDQVVDACVELIRKVMPTCHDSKSIVVKDDQDQDHSIFKHNTSSAQAKAFRGWLFKSDESSKANQGNDQRDKVSIKQEEKDPHAGDGANVAMVDKDSVVATPPDRLLVVIGTYAIGKEKIVKSVARVLNSKVFCVDPKKYRVYEQLDDVELNSLLTRDASACVHITDLRLISKQTLSDMVSCLRRKGIWFTRAIGLRPTGWTYNPKSTAAAKNETVSSDLYRLLRYHQSFDFGSNHLIPSKDSTCEYMVYPVPYSEHSSFVELSAFALSLDYHRIIATVNVATPASRAKMNQWFEKWANENRKRKKGQGGGGGGGEIIPRCPGYW